MSLTGNAESGYKLRGQLSGLERIRGYSAYEIAVMNGFEGTEKEWVSAMQLGKLPVKGVDYYTEEDKDEMVDRVMKSLPTWEGGSY